jgi:tRNA-intron endonuclease
MAKPTGAAGTLHGGHVEVRDGPQATRLYQRGFVGEPQAGNSLRLSVVEAAWLATQGRLDVDGLDAPALLAHGAGKGNRTEVEFLAYTDLRERGLVVRHLGGRLAVWPRGEGPPKPHAYEVQVAAERDLVTGASLAAGAEHGTVLAVVDEDGAVTHYQVGTDTPEGECPPGKLPPAAGRLLADRVLVTDGKAAAAYREREHLGTPTAAGLVLSFTEAESLRRRGVLSVEGDLVVRALSAQSHFQKTLPAYLALRASGVVVKSGFRFGTHLRGYRGDPDAGHAEWLLQCVDPEEELHWSELSRAIRLAHGVRKRFLVAVTGPAIRFVGLSWFKP